MEFEIGSTEFQFSTVVTVREEGKLPNIKTASIKPDRVPCLSGHGYGAIDFGQRDWFAWQMSIVDLIVSGTLFGFPLYILVYSVSTILRVS